MLTPEHSSDDCMKAAAYLPEALLDPKTALSEEPTETPMNVALKSNDSLWQWYEKDEPRRLRFGYAMEGLARANDPDAILEGQSLTQRSGDSTNGIHPQGLIGMHWNKMPSLSTSEVVLVHSR